MTEIQQTLRDVVTRSPRLRPRTKEIYLTTIDEFFGWSRGRISGPLVETWRDELARKLAPQTVNLKLAALRYATRRLAERTGNQRSDVARYAEMLKPGRPRSPHALTLEQARRLVATCSGDLLSATRDRALLVTGLRTGMRRMSLVGLNLCDVTRDELTITIKGGRSHTLRMDDETRRVLGAWLVLRADVGSRQSSAPLFVSLRPSIDGTTRIGDRLGPSGLYRIVRERGERAGLGRVHPHVFRHSCITWLREAGVPDWQIAKLTGHAIRGPVPALDGYTTVSVAPGAAIPSLL